MSIKKLVVSHAGSQGVLGLVETDLLRQLASHQTDLVYGHKSYRVSVDIVSHSFELTMSKSQDDVNKQPMLHIFWTDAETDAYRNHVKEQLSLWFDTLQKHNCNNYLVIHATFVDKAAIYHKFSVTKTSMSERIRNDFGPVRADKTIMFKAESNGIASSQSWLITVGKIRDSIIKSVTLKLAAKEKSVNQIRDTHEEEDFDLYKYIEAKEELCLLYELTGLYEEAYRSSEEVLSLFRQYVSNLRQCSISPWIMEFIERDITTWAGIGLTEDCDVKNLAGQELNSIQLCSVIFSRIAHQLTALQKPSELAKKGLNFLLQTVQECRILKSKCPRGALMVWVYIGCIELLEAIKKCSPLNNMDVPEPLAVAKGQLYNLAREKLHVIGGLVGHVVGQEPLSGEEVQVLITGSKRQISKQAPARLPSTTSHITSDLHKILTDKTFFHKQYIDLCQLAIVSFKQGSWNRHAQLIMMKQALYLRERGLREECLNAETHLRDVCHAYHTQGWMKLAAHSRVKLCDTQQYLGLYERELATCCHLSSDQDHITPADRQTYSVRLVECIERFNREREEQILIPFHPLLQYEILLEDNEADCVMVTEGTVRVKSQIRLRIRVHNFAHEPLQNVMISIKLDTGKETLNRTRSQISDHNVETSSEMEDGLYGISLKAETELQDDTERNGAKHDMLLNSATTTLQPGVNEVELTTVPSYSGTYGVSSLQVQIDKVVLRLKAPVVPTWLETITVEPEAPSVTVDIIKPGSGVWISGKRQYCTLSISTEKEFHSFSLSLKTPGEGLKLIPVENGTYSIEGVEEQGLFTLEATDTGTWTLTLPALQPHASINLPVPVISDSTDYFTQHILDITWSGSVGLSLLLTFYQPVLCDMKYRILGDRIFLISEIASNLPTNFTLTGCKLVNCDKLESVGEFAESVMVPKQKYSFIWQGSRTAPELISPDAKLELSYQLPSSHNIYTYTHPVQLEIRSPHFTVGVTCETEHPVEGECCVFEVNISVNKSEECRKVWRVLYEVHSDRQEWAVCGYKRRQINISDKARFKIEVLPLTSGQLLFPQIRIWEYKESLLQTSGNSRDMLYITSEDLDNNELKTLSSREADPLSVWGRDIAGNLTRGITDLEHVPKGLKNLYISHNKAVRSLVCASKQDPPTSIYRTLDLLKLVDLYYLNPARHPHHIIHIIPHLHGAC